MERGKIVFLMIFAVCAMISAKDYLGAELYSVDQVKYGRFEFRMAAAYGSGTLSTFFLYYDNSWEGLPEPWREIDMEVLGKNKDAFQSNIITGHAASKVTSEDIHRFDTDLTASYHTYAIEWTPDYIAWYFDGREVRRSDGQQVIDCRDQDQSYRFNTWISDVPAWVGPFDPADLPLYQYVNWIKYYEYTPGEGENGGDFTFSWEDEFDSFDSGRWGKANWTFEGNRVDFDPSNIVVKDGKLILCLTSKDAPGHSGAVMQDVPTNISPKNFGVVRQAHSPQTGSVVVTPISKTFTNPENAAGLDFYNLRGRRIGKGSITNKQKIPTIMIGR